MENSLYRRQQHAAARGGGDSGRLLQSKSGRAAAMAPVLPESEKIPIKLSKKIPKKQEETERAGGFATFLSRSRSQTDVPRRTRSGATSPSAWALSPGRPSPWSSPAQVPQSPARFEESTKQDTKGGSRGVSGVLKYFRQKKVSPVLEEEYHRYRIAYNRLLQWRFVNAQAEASMAVVRKAAQSQMRWLEEWWRIEKRNTEAVGRVVRKLSAITVCLPLVQNAEGDTASVDVAISTATEVMDAITTMIQGMHGQVEKTCFLLTELSVVLNHHKRMFQELETSVTHAASFAVQEKILRAQQIQLVNEANTIVA